MLTRHLAGWIAGAVAAAVIVSYAAETPGPRLTLLSGSGRSSVLVQLPDQTNAAATALDATDDRTVVVEIGPVNGSLSNQLLEAAKESPVVRQVRVKGTSRGAEGTLYTISIATKIPIAGAVRQSQGRIYIDLARRDASESRSGSSPASTPSPAATTTAARAPATSPDVAATSAAVGAPASPQPAASQLSPARGVVNFADIESRVERFERAGDVKGLERLRADLEARRKAAPGGSEAAAQLERWIDGMEGRIATAQQNRLAADAALFRSATPTAAPAGHDSASASSPKAAFRALRPQLEQIARAVNVWNGGPPPPELVTLSTTLAKLRNLPPPAEMSDAHGRLCASLDQLALLWATAAVTPPPVQEEQPVAERARVALDTFLFLERTLNPPANAF